MVQIRSLCTSERGNETQSEKQNHRTRDQISSPVNEFDLLIIWLGGALILFILGSGPVKGFALTLGVGILTTLFSVYFIARLMTALYVIKNKDKEKLI